MTDYEYYKRMFEEGKCDKDTLIRSLLSSLKFEAESNDQLRK